MEIQEKKIWSIQSKDIWSIQKNENLVDPRKEYLADQSCQGIQISYYGWGGGLKCPLQIDRLFVKNAHNMALSSQPQLKKKNQHSA